MLSIRSWLAAQADEVVEVYNQSGSQSGSLRIVTDNCVFAKFHGLRPFHGYIKT